MLRVIVPMCAVSMVLVSSCTGEGAGPDPAASVAGTRTSRAPVPPVGGEGVPGARMQAGTDSIAGVLSRLCAGDDCDAMPATPPRTLKLAGDGLLLFTVSSVPDQARVEVRRDGRDELVQRDALEPGTLMGVRMRVARGRYEVRLIARFAEQRAVWRFSLAVPERR